ncbi:MAG: ABC transporter substrate-binding protein [Synergistaceae bacterium]|nr:ABC transporter substrate-binding protein [Synergistota bacterium]NLM71003.1 ABC transporter substrate-binding protein [Synergistaceae bacterium]
MKRHFLSALALAVLLFSVLSPHPGWSYSDFDPKSYSAPKIKDLYLVIIRDPDAQIMALRNGQVDILGNLHRPVDVDTLADDTNVDLSLAAGFHGFFLGFNNREFPWDRVELRRAAWQALPREQIVRDLFAGYAEPLSTFLPPISPYFDPTIKGWPYDPDAARTALAEAGWTLDTDGVLISPDGRKIPPQKILSPTAAVVPTTAELAVRAAEALTAIGIPVSTEPMDFSAMLSRLDERDFQLYVLAWQMTRDPDSLYSLYSSKLDIPGGHNIPGISDPELDRELDRLRFAPDATTALDAASDAQRLLVDLAPVAPIYSRYSVSAVRRDWKDFLVTDRTTADNIWSLLSMKPASGPMRPLYLVQEEEPRALNPFTSSSAYDWQVMSLVYDALIAVDPYTLETIPWLATSWTVTTEDEGNGHHTTLTFHLREGVKWHDGHPLTARDAAYTYEFLRENKPPRYFDNVDNIERVEVPDDLTLVVTMKNVSFWHLHRIGGLPVLPRHIVEKVDDWRSWLPASVKHEEDYSLTRMIGSGPFILREYKPGEYVHLTSNEDFWLGGR